MCSSDLQHAKIFIIVLYHLQHAASGVYGHRENVREHIGLGKACRLLIDLRFTKTGLDQVGGIFAIAAVVDHFSDQLLKNPKVVEANPELNEWHTVKFPGRLPGLKFLRTLWVASVAGGPFQYVARELLTGGS